MSVFLPKMIASLTRSHHETVIVQFFEK